MCLCSVNEELHYKGVGDLFQTVHTHVYMYIVYTLTHFYAHCLFPVS